MMASVGHYQDPPLDFSYLDLKVFADLPSREPNKGKKKVSAAPAAPGSEDAREERKNSSQLKVAQTDSLSLPYPPSPGATSSASSKSKKRAALLRRGQHKLTTSLRLSYNKLEDWVGMVEAIDAVMPESQNLEWLDLSYNAFTALREKKKPNEKQPEMALLQFPRLRTLNLHANKISDLSGLSKLSTLSSLRKLTLYGNDDVTEKPFYRLKIIFELPQLRVLDDAVITKQERSDAQTWAQIHGAKKRASQ